MTFAQLDRMNASDRDAYLARIREVRDAAESAARGLAQRGLMERSRILQNRSYVIDSHYFDAIGWGSIEPNVTTCEPIPDGWGSID